MLLNFIAVLEIALLPTLGFVFWLAVEQQYARARFSEGKLAAFILQTGRLADYEAASKQKLTSDWQKRLQRTIFWRRLLVLVLMLCLIAALAVLAYWRSIPNFINRAKLAYLLAQPFCFVCLAGELFNLRLAKRWPNFMSFYLQFGLVVYSLSAGFYTLAELYYVAEDLVPYGLSSTDPQSLKNMLGFALGLLFCLALASLTLSNLRKLKLGTTNLLWHILLLWQMLPLATEIGMRAYALGRLPQNKFLFKLLAQLSNQRSYFLYMALVFVALVAVLVYCSKRLQRADFDNAAAYRKAKAKLIAKKRLAVSLAVAVAISLASITVLQAWLNQEVSLSPPEPFEQTSSLAKVDLEVLDDFHLHRFAYEAKNGNVVRFLAIQKSKGSYAVTLDACEICGASGYYEQGHDVVCKLCGVVMNRGTIGLAGGCNPIPLPFKIEAGKIVVELKDLEAKSAIFR